MGSTLDISKRKGPGRASDKSIVDLAGDVLRDIVILLHAELQLLRAEISEKLRLTALSAALIGAGALLLAATILSGSSAEMTLIARGCHRRACCLRNCVAACDSHRRRGGTVARGGPHLVWRQKLSLEPSRSFKNAEPTGKRHHRRKT